VSDASLDHRWVAGQDELESVIDELLDEPSYALDTEFHRERTYFPKLALLQLAWPGGLVLVDPLAVDVSSMRRLFDSEVLAVLHAAQQDLDVLTHAVGAVPRRLYDTQVAAGFVGYGTPSLVALLQGELRVSPVKGDRLTDWLRRPLTADQREYAASDVAYLLDVRDRLTAKLAGLGRTEWAVEACDELLARPVSGAAPWDAWQRLKDVRTLLPRGAARQGDRHPSASGAARSRRARHLATPAAHRPRSRAGARCRRPVHAWGDRPPDPRRGRRGARARAARAARWR
jgi:ribonuclease D